MDYKKFMYKALCASLFFAVPLCAQDSEEDQPVVIQPIDDENEVQPREERVTNGFNPRQTSHQGSNHKFVGLSTYHDQVVLEDTSWWSVAPEDQYKLDGWEEGDPIAITQARRKWWGNNDLYPYALYNEKKKNYVEVKISAQPFIDNFYRRGISDISDVYGNSFVVLTDGTLWPLKESDREIWRWWQRGDTIIIGTNDTYLPWFNPNILINITCSSTHVQGKRQKNY